LILHHTFTRSVLLPILIIENDFVWVPPIFPRGWAWTNRVMSGLTFNELLLAKMVQAN
jgi:hypothetical protein